MTDPLPSIRRSTDDRRCWTCAGWVEDEHLQDIGDCKLGPDPRYMFRKGVVLRMTAPDQVCDRWEIGYDAAQEKARVEGR